MLRGCPRFSGLIRGGIASVKGFRKGGSPERFRGPRGPFCIVGRTANFAVRSLMPEFPRAGQTGTLVRALPNPGAQDRTGALKVDLADVDDDNHAGLAPVTVEPREIVWLGAELGATVHADDVG